MNTPTSLRARRKALATMLLAMAALPSRPALAQAFPNRPSFAEAGLPDVVTASWLGVIAPPGIAADTVAQLNRAFVTALRDPQLRSKLEEQGWVVQPSTPQEFGARIRADIDRWAPIIRAANIKVTQ
jgi:tripartite-type tricarboxylate transporter receptor subunit TctC